MKTVDATGTVVNGYTYDVYGKKTSSTGSQANEFDFAGQQTDATGLQYLRARYYDPGTGTFLSRDPLAVFPAWTSHPFGYAGGNPAARTDPSGLRYDDASDGSNCASGCWMWSPDTGVNVAELLGGGGVILPNGYWFELFKVDGAVPTKYRVCRLEGEYKQCTTDDPSTDGWWRGQLAKLNADTVVQRILFALGVIRYTSDIDDVFSRLGKNHGISRETASERLHEIKRNNTFGGENRDVIFDRSGGVYDKDTGEFLDTLTRGGGP